MREENETASDDARGSIKDAVFGEANALGGGDIEGPRAGPDAQSAGPGDTNEGIIGKPASVPQPLATSAAATISAKRRIDLGRWEGHQRPSCELAQASWLGVVLRPLGRKLLGSERPRRHGGFFSAQ